MLDASRLDSLEWVPTGFIGFRDDVELLSTGCDFVLVSESSDVFKIGFFVSWWTVDENVYQY